MKENKIKEMQEKKIIEELRECSFQPSIRPYKPKDEQYWSAL